MTTTFHALVLDLCFFLSCLEQKGKGKKPEVVIVTAAYLATGSEQLNLEKGQLIQIRKKDASGWWEGETQVKGKKKEVGWFPAAYVKSLTAKP